MSIRIENVTRAFGDFAAVRELSLEVREGELLALLGPSGSGKTTLLRMIAGLDFPDSGRILFDGQDTTRLGAGERRVGFVFQHYALFRHMTVRDNVDFGLRVMPRSKRPSQTERRNRVMDLLARVGLANLADRYPAQLSGGQRQRVALARALAIRPRVLLLDEPFGALDAAVRKDLRRWLRNLHAEVPVTTVFVTHDQEEALDVADRVVVMNTGRIEQVGGPREVDAAPVSPFMYRFLGHANRFTVEIAGGRVMLDNRLIDASRVEIAPGLGEGRAEGYVRAHEIDIVAPSDPGADMTARLVHSMARGGLLRLELAGADGALFEVEAPREACDDLALAPDRVVGLHLRRMHVFAAAEGQQQSASPASWRVA